MDNCINIKLVDLSAYAVDLLDQHANKIDLYSRKLWNMRRRVRMYTASFLTAMIVIQPAYGGSLDEVQAELLSGFCAELKGEDAQDFFSNAGTELLNLCVPGGPGGIPGGGSSSSGGGAAGTQTSFVTIARRLSKAHGSEDESLNGGGAGDELSTDFNNGLSLFLSAQFEGLDRSSTRFETGYESNINGVTGGADFRFVDWFVGGVAVNYNNWDGDFNSRGGFEMDSVSPILYMSFLPAENFFADIMIEYTHQWRDRDRLTSFNDTATTVNTSGMVASDYESERFGANALFGYDHSIGAFTIGPRIGVRYSEMYIDGYTETGNTGLELHFLRDNVTSLQSTVGIQAAAALSTSFGVIVPQINADWTHEFKNDQRKMSAQFAQDGRSTPTTFKFQSDSPDRDFFHIGTGLGLVLPNGIQPFINFEALLGNSTFDHFVGTVGIRVEH